MTVPDTSIPLRARAGIATGNVVVGDLSGERSHQSAAISGTAPNRAARLQDLAEPGQLAIDDKTRELLNSSFEVEDLGIHQLKGLSPDVQVWRVGEEITVDSRFDAMSGRAGIKPLVGRKGDYQLIRDRWDHAVSGEGQVILLTGEAGIGKSRMIRQLEEDIRNEAKTVLRYQCSQYLSNAALHPFAANLERAAGLIAVTTRHRNSTSSRASCARPQGNPIRPQPFWGRC
ncbi:adenylate/guanylate cyclase domain-containing protein [Sulfitobacter aestuariivivens]|uniref:adenylate/guanylate cyclase domain-containing protein n=1 Tax=Sulfitobacter aestuariivivens TaxID=2766981 RepID=UPI003622A9B9